MVSQTDQIYIMNTALLEVSTFENVDYNDLQLRKSKKTVATWYIIQVSTKKIWFKKTFK
jgi:hypothetical protein